MRVSSPPCGVLLLTTAAHIMGWHTPGEGGRFRDGQVAEWLMAADCKSAAPCELRGFESSPVHHLKTVGSDE